MLVLCSFWGGKKGRKEKFLFCFWRKTAKNPRFFRMYRFCQLKTIFCACFACGLLACVVLPSWWYVWCGSSFKFRALLHASPCHLPYQPHPQDPHPVYSWVQSSGSWENAVMCCGTIWCLVLMQNRYILYSKDKSRSSNFQSLTF